MQSIGNVLKAANGQLAEAGPDAEWVTDWVDLGRQLTPNQREKAHAFIMVMLDGSTPKKMSDPFVVSLKELQAEWAKKP